MERLPAHQSKIYPNKTMREILELDDVKPMSNTTVNNHITRIGTVFNEAIKEGVITYNPANSLKKKSSSKSKKKNKNKIPYSPDDLQAILGRFNKYIDNNRQIKHNWAPIIALYMGMRVNEICQLYLDDFKVSEEGIRFYRHQ